MKTFKGPDVVSSWAGLAALVLLAVMPVVFTSNYLVGVLTVAAIYGIWAVSWDFMSGLTGRENFGHSLFIGVGAYAAGFLNVQFGLGPWWLRWCLRWFWDFPLCVSRGLTSLWPCCPLRSSCKG
jgi:ABC-type branched-subunit amino acid transport system permease subunit